MTLTPRDEAHRYVIGEGASLPWTHVRLAVAADREIERDLRAWVLEGGPETTPDTTPDTEAIRTLYELARDTSRLVSPIFLRVLDVLVDDEQVVVIVEAQTPLRAGAASTLETRVRELAAGLREAETLGLELRRLPPRALLDDSRLDPLELFLDGADATDARTLLSAALSEALRAGAAAEDHPLVALAERWRAASEMGEAVRLESLLDELDRAAGVPASPGAAWLLAGDAAGSNTPPVFSSNEPTIDLNVPRAAAPSSAEAVAIEEPPGAQTEGASAEVAPPRPAAEPAPAPRTRARRTSRRARRRTSGVLLGGVVLGVAVLVLGGLSALALMQQAPAPTPAATSVAASTPGPAQPATGQVLVALRAQEEAFVRATVDGTVLFDGTMRAGESKSWQGRQRVQVYTNKGRSMQITINGHSLGAYSPAMGHPDWNQIDFGFGPDWQP